MPAQSKQQQKFMGLVHAIQKGDVPASDATPQAQKVAKDMKPSDVKDFAGTKHTGLPKKVKQEILKRLKEYAFKVNHQKQVAAPKEPLRPDYEMDLQQETRIPQNFNVGTTRDYHTKLATSPREKYDKTNFNTAHSGHEDLEEAQAVSGGKVHKFITGKNLGFKGKKYTEIEFETLGVDNKNGTIRVKILAPREIFGNEMSLDFRSVRRGPYFKTDTSKVNEISVDTIHKLADEKGIKWDNEPSFLKLTKQLTGKEHLDDLTPRELIKVQQYLEKQSSENSLKEVSPCWDGFKQVGMKSKGGKQVPNCVKESVNEGIGTIALGVAGGLLLLKVLKFVVKKVVGAVGMNVTLPKEKLHKTTDELFKQTLITGGKLDMISFMALRNVIKEMIDNGQITKLSQIIKVIEKASKN